MSLDDQIAAAEAQLEQQGVQPRDWPLGGGRLLKVVASCSEQQTN